MKIDIRNKEKTMIITPYGRISIEESEELREVFKKLVENTDGIIVDMAYVDYISSACLRVFLMVRKALSSNCFFKAINCNDEVYEIIQMSGFDNIIEVSKSSYINFSASSFKEILAYRIKNNPNDIFITYGNCNYSWKDIEVYSQIIAHDLSLKGVKALSHIGIICANSVNFIVTFFALQKLGAIAVLFNNKLTTKEILSQCEIGDVSALCVGDYHIDENSELKEKMAFLYDISDSIVFSLRTNEYEKISTLYTNKVLADNPSVMLFSSGSTSKPKAVLLSTTNLINNINLQKEDWQVNEKDVLCLALPLFHIYAFKIGFVFALVVNCRICLTKNSFPLTIIETIEKEKCSLTHLVPTLMLGIINHQDFRSERLASLRLTTIGGASLTETQMLQVMRALPHLHIISYYGLSEIVPLSYTKYVDTEKHICHSVGVVSQGVSIKIINQDNKDCQKNEIGEILAKGESSFLSYYKLPLATQAMDAQGYVHTADLGYLDDENYLHLTGRIKDIIIRGGENILPNEIVEALTAFENITEAVVMGVLDDYYGEIVGACLVLKDKEKWDEKELRSFLKTKIAAFKIPVKYLLYDELPKLSNGKYDLEKMRKTMLK